jgi:hypothetical protein
MSGRVVSCTTQSNLPVTDQEAAAAVAAVHEMLGPGQVSTYQCCGYVMVYPGSFILFTVSVLIIENKESGDNGRKSYQ